MNSTRDIAERLDAANLIARLIGPCDNGPDEHSWRDCQRCLALELVQNRDPMALRLLLSAETALKARAADTVKLGVIEFHPKEALRTRFYAVVKDLRDAGCIVDLWLMDIATVLSEHGYEMTIARKPVSR